MAIEDQNKPDLPAVELITINHNGREFLNDYFRALCELEYPQDKLHLYFVDNNSRDGSLDYLRRSSVPFKLTVIANKKNYGFARASNMVFKRCSAPYVGLLNNDTKVDRMWLARLVEKIQSDSSVGMVSSREIPQEASRKIDPQTNEISWCCGGHCLIRSLALEKTGYFDERFFMYAEDVDLSWRMWLAGYKCVNVPQALCEHHHTKIEQYRIRRLYFYVRNSILLRYAYGTGRQIQKAIARWSWEAGSLGLKRLRLKEACTVALAVLAHLFYIPYFLKKRKNLIASANFKEVRRQWIIL